MDSFNSALAWALLLFSLLWLLVAMQIPGEQGYYGRYTYGGIDVYSAEVHGGYRPGDGINAGVSVRNGEADAAVVTGRVSGGVTAGVRGGVSGRVT